MTTITPDPISNNVDRVLVRSTVTGFEQGIAAVAGLVTAGPLGALASWGTIRGVQGKWTPWFILGVPGMVAINVVNVVALAAIGGASGGDSSSSTSYVPSAPEPAPIVASVPTPSPSSSSSLPSYNNPTNGGTSTLVQKCTWLADAQNDFDLGRVAELSFQIGFEHDTPMDTTVDEDCASVGVYTF